MDSDTTAMAMDSDSTARGLLMLSLRLRLILTTLVDTDTPDISDTEDSVSDMPDSDTATSDTDMVIDTCMARGLLMLSLRLRLILTTMVDTDWDTLDISDMPDSDTATESRLNQDLSVNQQLEPGQKWIVISLKFPSPVLQFQCYHTKSLVMVSRKQENQSGKNPTNIKITKK